MKYLILMFLVSCGEDYLRPEENIDPSLKEIFFEFQSDASSHFMVVPDFDLPVFKFVSPNEKDDFRDMSRKLGICLEVPANSNTQILDVWGEIWISRDHTSACHLKVTVYHELAHCYLNLEHSKSKTIMHEESMYRDQEESCLDDWDYNVRKLFTEGV